MNKKKKWLIVATVAVVVTAAAVTAVILSRPEEPEPSHHQILAGAMAASEAKNPFMLQIISSGTLSAGNVSQTVQTAGYLYDDSSKDYTSIYVNTSSTTENAQTSDYDVTLSMYCDGEGVYDNTGSTPVAMDMTCQEFQQIVSQYSLYHYDPALATDISYNKNETEGFDGGQYSVTLSRPSDAVLAAYADIIAQATGETVAPEDLQVMSAYAIYSVYSGQVVSQTCSFTVNYTMSDGRTAQYSAVNQVAYLQVPEQAETEEDAS